MRYQMKAGLVAAFALAACGNPGTPDPEPRPQTVDEYFAAFSAAVLSDSRQVPMLLKAQKRRAMEKMGGRADAEDFQGSPTAPPDLVEKWRATGIVYFNAPFGTVEERRAWEAYMAATQKMHEADPAEGPSPD